MPIRIDQTYTYRPTANHAQAQCRVRIYDESGQPTTVVLTELGINTGMSITNASQEIATGLAAQHQLDPKSTRWIEHYTPDSYRERSGKDETFDEIIYTWDPNKTAHHPTWRRMALEEVEVLTGMTWASGNLTDDTNRIAESFGMSWVQDDWEEL